MDLRDLYLRCCCRQDQTLLYGRPMISRRASGCWVWFEGDDEPYLDLVCGYSATNLGHCPPRVAARLAELGGLCDQVHSVTSAPAVRLAERLCRLLAGPERYRVYYTVGGSGAVDAAVRVARAYTGRPIVASFAGSFHGFGLASLPLTDESYVAGQRVAPLPGARLALPFGDIDGCGRILRRRRRRVAAVIVEPVQGAAGFVLPPDRFLPALGELCRRLGVLLIADDIQCGLGRTGDMLACRQLGLDDPDVLLLGKSLAGGCWPLSAMVARRELFESLPTSGSTLGDTFSHNAIGCGLALEVLDILEGTDVLANARRRGAEMLDFLRGLVGRPPVAAAWGLGAALAVRIAAPDPAATAARIVQAGLHHHVLLYATGPARDRLKFAPPLTISADETRQACRRVARAFDDALP